jgi:hypothetical protein
MIYSTATVPVNPEGETKLTREQAWNGLKLKARDARLFLPPGLCTRCEITGESATHFVREATIAGADLREIITLEAQRKVTFFQATGPREGAIVNELFEDEAGALQLRFYCFLGLRDKDRSYDSKLIFRAASGSAVSQLGFRPDRPVLAVCSGRPFGTPWRSRTFRKAAHRAGAALPGVVPAAPGGQSRRVLRNRPAGIPARVPPGRRPPARVCSPTDIRQ